MFHAMDGVVTLVFADGTWVRDEEGTVPCAMGGTTHTKITAEYPLPGEGAGSDPPRAQRKGSERVHRW